MNEPKIKAQYAILKVANLDIAGKTYNVLDIYSRCDTEQQALDELKEMYQPGEGWRTENNVDYIIEKIYTLTW